MARANRTSARTSKPPGSSNGDRPYVLADEGGVLRVGGTRVSLDSVVVAFQEGHSAEAIRLQYPALTLEAVYGAVTYYLAHRGEVEEYLEHQDAVWKRARRESEEQLSPVVRRLRASLHAEAVGGAIPEM